MQALFCSGSFPKIRLPWLGMPRQMHELQLYHKMLLRDLQGMDLSIPKLLPAWGGFRVKPGMTNPDVGASCARPLSNCENQLGSIFLKSDCRVRWQHTCNENKNMIK